VHLILEYSCTVQDPYKVNNIESIEKFRGELKDLQQVSRNVCQAA